MKEEYIFYWVRRTRIDTILTYYYAELYRIDGVKIAGLQNTDEKSILPFMAIQENSIKHFGRMATEKELLLLNV